MGFGDTAQLFRPGALSGSSTGQVMPFGLMGNAPNLESLLPPDAFQGLRAPHDLTPEERLSLASQAAAPQAKGKAKAKGKVKEGLVGVTGVVLEVRTKGYATVKEIHETFGLKKVNLASKVKEAFRSDAMAPEARETVALYDSFVAEAAATEKAIKDWTVFSARSGQERLDTLAKSLATLAPPLKMLLEHRQKESWEKQKGTLAAKRNEAREAAEVLKPWKFGNTLNFARWLHNKGVLLLESRPEGAAADGQPGPPARKLARHASRPADHPPTPTPAWSCKVQVTDDDQGWRTEVPTLYPAGESGLSSLMTSVSKKWGSQVEEQYDKMLDEVEADGKACMHVMLEVQGFPHDTVAGMEWVPETHRGVEKQPQSLETFGSAWLAVCSEGYARAGQHLVPCDGMGTLVQQVAGAWCVAMWPSTAITTRWG